MFQVNPTLINKCYAFIDESGNFGFDFDKPGVSSHFIITAVIVDENNITKLEEQFEKVRSTFFQTGEMKPSKVSSDDLRRIRILQELSKLDFGIFTLIVDKTKIYQDSGLGYKRSFIKFLNNLVHEELYRVFPRLEIISDEHGSKEFMEEFRNYVNSQYTADLFEEYDFGFANSRETLLIQLSDFLSGTIATGFDVAKKNSRYLDFIKIIKPKITYFKEFPRQFENYLINAEIYRSTKFKETIALTALRLTKDYIEKNSKSKDEDVIDRIRFLNFMELNLRFNNPERYISTNEILLNLNSYRDRKIDKYQLRANIVAKLRDDGILIASSTQGYKLPISEKEIYDFVNHSSTIINPMLHRLKKCREQIKIATQNNLDILDKKEYINLKRLLDSSYGETSD